MLLVKSLLQRASKKQLAAIAAALLLFTGIGQESFAQVGGQPGAYLRSPVGASAFAMGGAQAASPDYLSAWINPAMMPTIRRSELTIGGGLRSLDRSEAYSSFEFKVSPRLAMGFAGLYRGDGNINNLVNANEEALSSGSYTTMTLKAAFGYILTKTMTLGLSLGYYYQRLPTIPDGTSLIYSTATAIGGMDFALRWKPSKVWSHALLIQNIDVFKMLSGKGMGIQMAYDAASTTLFSQSISDTFLPVITVGSRFETKLNNRPFAIVGDVNGYVINGSASKLNKMNVRLNTGCEWKEWETFLLRAGIGDMLLSGDMFSPRFTLGFGADLSRVHKGLKVNYGLATDRVWAGVDQQADFSFTF